MGGSKSSAGCVCETACMPDCSPAKPQESDVPAVSKLALGATGMTVAACAACCVLPLAWPAIGLVLTGSMIGAIERSQPWLTAISLVFVAAAWGMVWRASRRAGKRANPTSWFVLCAATLLLAIALCWRQIEPVLLATLN